MISQRNILLTFLLFCIHPDRYPESPHKICQTDENHISSRKINPKLAPKPKFKTCALVEMGSQTDQMNFSKMHPNSFYCLLFSSLNSHYLNWQSEGHDLQQIITSSPLYTLVCYFEVECSIIRQILNNEIKLVMAGILLLID